MLAPLAGESVTGLLVFSSWAALTALLLMTCTVARAWPPLQVQFCGLKLSALVQLGAMALPAMWVFWVTKVIRDAFPAVVSPLMARVSDRSPVGNCTVMAQVPLLATFVLQAEASMMLLGLAALLLTVKRSAT